MKSKYINGILIIIFVLAISIPLITIKKVSGTISILENRVLAKFPTLSPNGKVWDNAFITDFEAWFNDNLGFRDTLVKANSNIQYKFFDILTRKDTVIGKNQWLYLMFPYMYKSYQNLDIPTEARLQLFDERFNHLKNYFGEIQVPFITMVVPDKETIYPEYMPDTILKQGNISKTDIVLKHLAQKDGIDIFSPKDALINAKNKATVYSQNYDSHWNNYGAFVGYLDLMNRLKKYFPEIKILDWNDFSIEEYSRKSPFLGTTTFIEKDYKFTKVKGYSAIQDRAPLENLNSNRIDLTYHYVNKSNPHLPKLLISGDSFIYLFMLPNIAESFSEVTFTHWIDMDNIKSTLNTIKPDLFLLEFMEPSIDQYLDTISYSDDYFDNIYPPENKFEDGYIWLDHIDDKFLDSPDKIVIDKSSQVVNFKGWALDRKEGTTAENVYIKVGDKKFFGTHNIPRNKVADYFANSALVNSGFSIDVETSELIKASKFSIVVTSSNKEIQYAPVEYKVEIK